MGRPAKALLGLNRAVGSNPTLSARSFLIKSLSYQILRNCQARVRFWSAAKRSSGLTRGVLAGTRAVISASGTTVAVISGATVEPEVRH